MLSAPKTNHCHHRSLGFCPIAGTVKIGLISLELWLAGAFPVSPVPAQLVPTYDAPGPAAGTPVAHTPLSTDQSPNPLSKPTGTLAVNVVTGPVTNVTSSTNQPGPLPRFSRG